MLPGLHRITNITLGKCRSFLRLEEKQFLPNQRQLQQNENPLIQFHMLGMRLLQHRFWNITAATSPLLHRPCNIDLATSPLQHRYCNIAPTTPKCQPKTLCVAPATAAPPNITLSTEAIPKQSGILFCRYTCSRRVSGNIAPATWSLQHRSFHTQTSLLGHGPCNIILEKHHLPTRHPTNLVGQNPNQDLLFTPTIVNINGWEPHSQWSPNTKVAPTSQGSKT